MYRALVAAAYVAVAFYFLRSYRRRITWFGVIASILWPLALAFAIGVVIRLDDDDVMML